MNYDQGHVRSLGGVSFRFRECCKMGWLSLSLLFFFALFRPLVVASAYFCVLQFCSFIIIIFFACIVCVVYLGIFTVRLEPPLQFVNLESIFEL